MTDAVSPTLEFPIRYGTTAQPAVNPYWLGGKGSVAIHERLLGLEGRRGFPFLFSRRRVEIVAFEDIDEVELAGHSVTFKVEHRTKSGKPRKRPVRLIFHDTASAYALASALPARAGEAVAVPRAEAEAFARSFSKYAGSAIVVPALVVLNVLLYLWVAYRTGGWLGAAGDALIRHGSLFGPLATGGEWWRLATAMFLHGGVIHLLMNMYALWDTGRFCEQLFGRWRFLVIYLLSGLAGSAASLWWNPYVNSVGASGAVFGVYGALLAFMLDKRNGVPVTVMQTHQISVLVFIGYAVVFGAITSYIDNAAHAGGLVAGALAGWSLSRAIGRKRARGWWLKPVAGVSVVIATAAALVMLAPNTRPPYDAHRRFLSDIGWYAPYEQQLLAASKSIAERAAAQKVSTAEFTSEVKRLSDGWRDARQRLLSHRLDTRVSNRRLIELQSGLAAVIELRQRAMTALLGIADPAPARQAQAGQEFRTLWTQSTAEMERLRAQMKAQAENPGRRRRELRLPW